MLVLSRPSAWTNVRVGPHVLSRLTMLPTAGYLLQRISAPRGKPRNCCRSAMETRFTRLPQEKCQDRKSR